MKNESQSVESLEKASQSVASPRVERLQGLLEISYLVGSVMQLDDILNQIVVLTAQMLDTPACGVYLFGPKREHLTLRACVGLDPNKVGLVRLPVGIGLVGKAVEENQMIAVADGPADPRFADFEEDSKYHAYICAPLRIQDKVIGVMTARRHDVHHFTSEECTLFETVCQQVAIVIEKSIMYYEKLEADRLAAISISLSEIAHYIKNLLQGMKGGIYFADMGLKRGDLDMARKGWDVLRRGNKKIASLVENMLNFSREMQINLKPCNINSLIFDILHQIDDSAVERGVAILPETQREMPNILVDYDRIYDALLNLLGNAIDAIPSDRDDGLVMIITRLSDNKRFVEVVIKDNGCGISPEIQKKIFNLFFSTKGERGTGIGLAVTRKIIEAHNGQILLESEEGKGTTFTVQLPVDHLSSQKIEIDS